MGRVRLLRQAGEDYNKQYGTYADQMAAYNQAGEQYNALVAATKAGGTALAKHASGDWVEAGGYRGQIEPRQSAQLLGSVEELDSIVQPPPPDQGSGDGFGAFVVPPPNP